MWLIDSVPLKTNKLIKLNANFAYLKDKNGYPLISWNLRSEPELEENQNSNTEYPN